MKSNILCKDTCVTRSSSELGYLQHSLRERMSELTATKLNSLFYGFFCHEDKDELFRKLGTYDDWISKHLSTMNCLTSCQVQHAVESIQSLIGSNVCDMGSLDLQVDKSDYPQWFAQNPGCVPREEYELCACNFCGDLEFNVDLMSRKDMSRIYYDFSAKKLDTEILAMIRVYKNDCKLKTSLRMKKEVCSTANLKIELEMMLRKTNCDLDLKTFQVLRQDCQMPVELINKVYDCGMTLDFDPVSQSCPILSTGVNQYNLCDTLFDVKNCKK